MSKKRRREPLSIDAHLVEIYDDLANEHEDIRFKAAHALLTKISSEQENSPDQLAEIVRRLIRGLCSGRKAARVGFSIALTELLSQRWGQAGINGAENLQIRDLIDILTKQTEITGKVSGQEERDHHFGRLFGAEAFIKSGILFRPDAPSDAWSRILDIIYEIARKKSWLREECGWVLFEACQTWKKSNHDLSFIQALLDKLDQYELAKTPEGIAIWLSIQGAFPEAQFPNGTWRDGNPLHPKEKSRLAKILKEASTGDDMDETNRAIPQKGNWTSKIHFAWNVVFAELTRDKPKSRSTSELKTVSLEEFWREAVDEHLFASSSSEERKYWGFLLFQQLVKSASVKSLPALFTPNFKRCLINQLASKDRYLHRAAEKSVKSIFSRVETEPSAARAPLESLSSVSLDGHLSFDQLTKSKTLERLVSLADDKSLCDIGYRLMHKFGHPGIQDERDTTAKRQVIADELTLVVKSPQSSHTGDDIDVDMRSLIDIIIQAVVKWAYFSPDASKGHREDVPKPPVSSKTQDMLRARLASWLSHIIAKAPNPGYFAYMAITTIRLKESNDAWHSNIDLTGLARKSMHGAWHVVQDVQTRLKKEPTDKAFLEAFQLLYSLTILQVYNGDADAVSMLDELHSCYDLKVSGQSNVDQGGSEILIEILLGLLAKPSQLFKRLARQVFCTCTSDINGNGLNSMIKVLETRENLAGQEEMFEEEDGDTESDEATAGVGSDVEELGMEDANGIHHPSNGEGMPSTANGSGEETDGSEETEGNDEELAAFDMKLAQALKTRPATADLDESSGKESSDADMDDEQMEALDEHIAIIFKERKKAPNKKTQKKDAKETIINFKCRVLELLEIYIKQQHQGHRTLALLLPLLTVIRTTTSSVVSGKACNLVRDYNRMSKGKELPRINKPSRALGLLKDVHAEAMREGSNVHASACSQASLLVVKVLVAHDRDSLQKVVRIYAKTQQALLLDPQCKVKMSFFTDWLNWCSTARAAR